jgi:hypothetical protein
MSKGKSSGRKRRQMILLAMRKVAGDATRLCAYEDIVVEAWKLFPQEFGLRGYADKYPDSSDLHKPLYGSLKREGYVRVQNKKFGLTDSGLAAAERLRHPADERIPELGRVGRDQRIEIERLAKKASVALLEQAKADELVDTDLYDFYGVTVRTKPADFAGRITAVDAAVDAAVAAQDPSIDKQRLAWVVLTRDELKTRWAELIAELTAASQKARPRHAGTD